MKIKVYLVYKLLLLSIVLISCEPEDQFYDLSQEAKELLAYEEGETFKLKNEITNEIITFTVASKTVKHEKARKQISHMYSGQGGDTFYETGTIIFTDNNNCYGEIHITAERNNEYDFQIHLYGCFEELFYTQTEYFGSTTVNGIEYQDVYLLKYWPNELYYSKWNGIIKIGNEYEGTTEFSIVE